MVGKGRRLEGWERGGSGVGKGWGCEKLIFFILDKDEQLGFLRGGGGEGISIVGRGEGISIVRRGRALGLLGGARALVLLEGARALGLLEGGRALVLLEGGGH